MHPPPPVQHTILQVQQPGVDSDWLAHFCSVACDWLSACLGGPPQVGAVMRVCWANLGAIMCHVMLPRILSSPTYTQHI